MANSPPIDPRMLSGLLGGAGAPPGGPQSPVPAQAPGPPAGGQGLAGDPTLPPVPGGQTPMGMQQASGSPTDQVIWQAFPSTDPSVIGQMMQGAEQQGPDGMLQILPQLEQMFSQDEDALHQRQQATLQAILTQLMGPDQSMMQQPQAGPGVVGGGGGYG